MNSRLHLHFCIYLKSTILSFCFLLLCFCTYRRGRVQCWTDLWRKRHLSQYHWVLQLLVQGEISWRRKNLCYSTYVYVLYISLASQGKYADEPFKRGHPQRNEMWPLRGSSGMITKLSWKVIINMPECWWLRIIHCFPIYWPRKYYILKNNIQYNLLKQSQTACIKFWVAG